VPQVHDEISALALLLNAMFDRLEDCSTLAALPPDASTS